MKPRLLDYLACPECGGELALSTFRIEGEEILEGELRCGECGVGWPIVGVVPRFVDSHGIAADRTAQAFGYEWTRYQEIAGRYRQQFLDWLRPVGPEFFQGKLVLEGGCGKGRHTALAAEFGARDVVSLDLSAAVDVAFHNTRHLANAHVVQADLNRPPLKAVFDYAFSVGVLHHLPDPERGFRALVSRLRPGGAVSAWVYGREGNGWIVHLVSPVRERVTARMPHALLDPLAALLTVPLYLATKLLYRPTRRSTVGRLLPYREYLSYISDFPFSEQRWIIFDHLVAPVAFYLRRDEVLGWFERLGLEDVRIEHHNGNSWRGFGRRPAAAGGEQ